MNEHILWPEELLPKPQRPRTRPGFETWLWHCERGSCKTPCGMGVPPMNHGQDARATLADREFCKSLKKLRRTRFALLAPAWRPGRNSSRTNPPKTAWERTPYYTRTYSAGPLFIRGEKPRELARIAKITARQWQHYQSVTNRNNPVLQGLQWMRLFENESVRTYAQAAEIAGVHRSRVFQLVSLVTRLPSEITDFLVANKDPFIRAHFSERRLRPLTLLESDERKVKQFHEMLTEVARTD